MLDPDSCYQALGVNESKRIEGYRDFFRLVVPDPEQLLFCNACQRNQLSGNSKFIDKIELRVGIRIEQRGRGRPAKEGKNKYVPLILLYILHLKLPRCDPTAVSSLFLRLSFG
ncbi:MAG: hypothetical protein ACJAUP_000341 [Cellvibrionaceae bacterium]|jgi:hypothetical protein